MPHSLLDISADHAHIFALSIVHDNGCFSVQAWTDGEPCHSAVVRAGDLALQFRAYGARAARRNSVRVWSVLYAAVAHSNYCCWRPGVQLLA